MSTLMKTKTKHTESIESGGPLSPGGSMERQVVEGKDDFTEETLFELCING